jgi:hypothetical protein
MPAAKSVRDAILGSAFQRGVVRPGEQPEIA